MGVTLGQAIFSSVKPIIKIYLIIGLGFFLGRIDVLSVTATRIISNLVLTVFTPCLAFSKIVTNIEDQDIKTVGIVCLTSLLVFGTGLLFGFLVRYLFPVPKQWYGGVLAGSTFPNISDLPIAYLQTLGSGILFTPEEVDKGVADVCIFLVMFLMCLFNFGAFRLVEMDFVQAESGSVSSAPNQGSMEASVSDDVHHKAVHHVQNSKAQDSDPGIDLSMVSIDSFTENYRDTDIGHYSRDLEINSLHDYSQNATNQLKNSCVNTSQSNIPSSISSVHSNEEESLQDNGFRDLIKEYSHAEHNENQDLRLRRIKTSINSSHNEPQRTQSLLMRVRNNDITRIVTSEAAVSRKDIDESGGFLPKRLRSFNFIRLLIFFLKNCLRPVSLSLIISLTIAFIPWLKALFVTSKHTPHLPNAPDGQPILNFMIDFTAYVGSAAVPFGLMLLGATLGRLKINKLYPGFWKAAVVLVIIRLCIMPIFGVLWCDRLIKAGWLDRTDDRILLFVIVINWSLPTMTAIIYFTASFTPPENPDPIQMQCVAFFLIIQYPILVVTLPFVVTYFLKVQLNY